MTPSDSKYFSVYW